jgi:glycosyltransferase involved in cell wall biosynthesis
MPLPEITIDRSLIQTEEEMLARWGEYDKPLVSINCITYNHEKYIRDALDGFLIQKTDFPFEILVHDDASTDGTADIIREYEKRYPKIIKPIYQVENQFSKGNRPSNFNFGRAEGKYIAFCEGDDFWFDPLKLQTQISSLERNQNISGSAHQSIVVYESKEKENHFFRNNKSVLQLTDLMEGRIFHTASFVFRKSIIDKNKMPDDILSGDRFLFLKCALYGDIEFLDKAMCIYRKSSSGISSWVSYELLKKDLKMPKYLYEINSEFPMYRYLSFIHKTLISYPSNVGIKQILFHYILYLSCSFSYFPGNIKKILAFSIRSFPKILVKNICK